MNVKTRKAIFLFLIPIVFISYRVLGNQEPLTVVSDYSGYPAEVYVDGYFDWVGVPPTGVWTEGLLGPMDFEDYIHGVVMREIHVRIGIDPDAFTAQALAAMTKLAHEEGACSGATVTVRGSAETIHQIAGHPVGYQAFTNRVPSAAVENAVTVVYNADDEEGDIIKRKFTIGNTTGYAIIDSLFSSHCDGYTRDSEDYSDWNYKDVLRRAPCICGFDFYFGHGVGMCQYGAIAEADAGQDYDDILLHYYHSSPPIIEYIKVVQDGTFTGNSADRTLAIDGGTTVYEFRWLEAGMGVTYEKARQA